MSNVTVETARSKASAYRRGEVLNPGIVLNFALASGALSKGEAADLLGVDAKHVSKMRSNRANMTVKQANILCDRILSPQFA